MEENRKKKILITGSSRGIGAACARLACSRGYEVILHGKTESEQLKKLANELSCSYVVFDVSDEEAVGNALAEVNNIDVLVNNAGINLSAKFEDLTTEMWQGNFNVNVLGVVNVTKAVLPGMRKAGYGRIVMISSIRAFPSGTSKASYASTKAALNIMAVSLAKEYAKEGITVNAVAPGFTNTDMFAVSYKANEHVRKQVETIPLKRAGEPNEIAEAVLFLAGAGYITGQVLAVDGGYCIK